MTDLVYVSYGQTGQSSKINNSGMREMQAKFDKVTYNYYEQLNGYTYLKSLGIGYHFGSACLNLDLFGEHGARYNPREWFTVPLHIINQAIELIISGEIINYRYNYTSEMINLI